MLAIHGEPLWSNQYRAGPGALRRGAGSTVHQQPGLVFLLGLETEIPLNMDEHGGFFINCDMMRISWDIPNQHFDFWPVQLQCIEKLIFHSFFSLKWLFPQQLFSLGWLGRKLRRRHENFTGWQRFYSRVPCLECCARYPIYLQTMTWQSLPLTLSNQISWCPGWMVHVHDSWWGGYSNKVWEWLKIAPKVDGEIMLQKVGSIKRPRWLDIPIPFFFFVISCPNI